MNTLLGVDENFGATWDTIGNRLLKILWTFCFNWSMKLY